MTIESGADHSDSTLGEMSEVQKVHQWLKVGSCSDIVRYNNQAVRVQIETLVLMVIYKAGASVSAAA